MAAYTGNTGTNSNHDLFDRSHCQAAEFMGIQILDSPVSGTSQSETQSCSPVFQLCTNIVAEARVAEAVPDAYTDALRTISITFSGWKRRM